MARMFDAIANVGHERDILHQRHHRLAYTGIVCDLTQAAAARRGQRESPVPHRDNA